MLVTKYKIIGGPRAGELIVPDAPNMQRPPNAKPIAASDPSPLADAARQEAQADRSYELRPVIFDFPNEPSIKVYAPEDYTDDDVLRDLGLTALQRLTRDCHMIKAAVKIYENPQN